MSPSNIAVWRCVLRRSGPPASSPPMPRPERFAASRPGPPAHSTEVSPTRIGAMEEVLRQNLMSPLSDLVNRFRVSEHSGADYQVAKTRPCFARKITRDYPPGIGVY
jgi:hypothetical protein